MTSPRVKTRRLLITVSVGLASAFGVGALAHPAVAAAKPSKTAKVKAGAPTTFPKLKVLDLATAKTIDLASLNVSAKPQLVWFWAPT